MKRFIGDKQFYKMVFAVALPIIIQNAITNFVNLLDNIMVGSLCTEAMTGVSIVNQLFFVFNLTVFGAVSAAGIFTAQYHGLKDYKGETYTFRFKFLILLIGCAVGIVLFLIYGRELISFFISAEANVDTTDPAKTMEYATDYLRIMMFGLLPFAMSQVYSSTLRETGETVVPMFSSVVSVSINFILNYLLIFGKLGLPCLGVKGAAIATVVARFAELAILVLWTHLHSKRYPFIIGALRSPYIPGKLVAQITVRGLPLMLNEFLWAMGVTITNQCYSTRGLDALAAINIASTINNLFNIVFLSMGSVIAIIVGNQLGAGESEKALDTDRKLIVLSVMSAVGMGILLIGFAPIFPLFYNTTQNVRSLATYLIMIFAAIMPFHALAHASYFTLRSGGQVFITILFDSVFMWVVAIPVARVLADFTKIGIKLLFPICHGLEAVKAFLGLWLVNKKTWVKQLVSRSEKENS
ncbi:MAG: MATE family efflux transporter [Ruminococcaceae bacterium]|nr:MATE family efflux transporter [Oscillospiraceae bacterium]